VERLRTSKAADGTIQPWPEFGEIIWRPVGENVIGVGPDILGGIEFGRVRRKLVGLQAWMAREEGAHLSASVNGVAIGEQFDRAAEMAEQMVQ
jgi:hypothetical protein